MDPYSAAERPGRARRLTDRDGERRAGPASQHGPGRREPGAGGARRPGRGQDGAAADQPLICLIDDEQWLGLASEQTLGFVARRLGADPVALVFSARNPGTELAGQPELVIEGLRADHARTLLDSVLAGPLDAGVRDLIVAETRGNPLALLELPRGLTPAELAASASVFRRVRRPWRRGWSSSAARSGSAIR
jgi:hypothetical protein